VGLVIIVVGVWQVVSGGSQSPTAPPTTSPGAASGNPTLPAGVLNTGPAAALAAQVVVPAGGAGHLSDPHEAVSGPDHTIYVVDPGVHAVVVYRVGGGYVRSIGATNLKAPFSLVLGANDHLFVLDADASHVVDYAGLGKSVAGTLGTFGRAIAAGTRGNIVLADPAHNDVAVYTPQGVLLKMVQSPLSSALGQFNQPSSVSVAPDGSVFVLDNINQRVEKFTPDWKAVGQWPAPVSDTFHSAHVLALSASRFLVSDPRGSLLDYDVSTSPATIHRYTLTGAPAANPVGLALLDKDHVLVTDSNNRAVWSVPVPASGK
jgi:hypothetical protein